MEDEDDEALEWAGEGADPTLAAGEARARRAQRAAGSSANRAGDSAANDEGDDSGDDDSADDAASSSALLIASGIAAGLYLLYAIAWAITATRQGPTVVQRFEPGDGLGQGMYTLGLWLAVAAPPVWFAVVLLVTRDSRVRARVLWLVAGLVLLAPLPFLKGA
ncbi:hypothetical protein C5D07_13175 [Rathayibacter tritici]|nr:hypothetical protein C5C06_12995 [Rathayibacter tritici]PPI12353.1 hypothetical protein C5D07_13175 [Rathayibacter tritici]PPI42347.1 hypothetical protein C5D18_13360 [Rathayibacter tritici]